jgi:uncharacterized protein
MNREEELIYSSLERTVTEGGKTIEIKIYRLPETRWTLEVIDQYNTSTVWDDEFDTDQAALDEVLHTLREEGIDSLSGPPSTIGSNAKIDGALTAEEFEELDDFLSSADIQDSSMDVSTLDGFLTAIAISPRLVPPSVWLPWVWDMDDAENAPEFESEQHVNQIMSLIMRHYNTLVHTFNCSPDTFKAIFWENRQWGAAEWCEGFLLGTQMDAEIWALLFAGQPKWFAPFMRFGTQEGLEITEKQDDAEQMMNEIEPSILRMHGYWRQYEATQPSGMKTPMMPVVRSEPKVGRNDPCPCGSGKKFKKCCGVSGGTPTLH